MKLTNDEMREAWQQTLSLKAGDLPWLVKTWRRNPAKVLNSEQYINNWLAENNERWGDGDSQITLSL